jgi:hypothetical protein
MDNTQRVRRIRTLPWNITVFMHPVITCAYEKIFWGGLGFIVILFETLEQRVLNDL